MKQSLWIVLILSSTLTACSLVGSSTTTADPNADALSQAIVVLSRSQMVKEPETPMIEFRHRSFAFLTFVGCPWLESMEGMGIDQITDDFAAERAIELIVDAKGKSIERTTATREQYIDGFEVFFEEMREQDDPLWQFAVCEQLHEEHPLYVNE
jgi:hypothetical protein